MEIGLQGRRTESASVSIVSVDDHVIEPPDIFDGRLPPKFREVEPRVVQVDATSLPWSGSTGGKWDAAENPMIAGTKRSSAPRDAWLVEGQLRQLHGMESCMGRPAESWGMYPLSYAEMRPGSYNVAARIADMDLNGVYASVNFPSMWVGFCGRTFFSLSDKELGVALARAWNAWQIEEWIEPYPSRFIGLQLPILCDPLVAAEEVKRNAERGFKAVTFSDNPTGLGLPSIHSGHWDRFFAACEETGTVVCLHIGSGGKVLDTSDDAPIESAQSLSPANAIVTAVEWVWSRVPVRFPDLRIALSEGGIGWVPLAMDWMDHTMRTHSEWTHGWDGIDLLPGEVLLRNFWFCALDEPHGVRALADSVGTEKLMVEVDYPHADSTWPNTRAAWQEMTSFLEPDQVDGILWRTACELFAHPFPA
jgi:predicted TIM-barrel fold metal-dependent hydrolase